MFRMNRFIPLAAGLVLAGAAGAQSAGEMTADEITEAFNKQKTRGLVLVPTNPQAEAPAPALTIEAPEASAAEASEDQIEHFGLYARNVNTIIWVALCSLLLVQI